MIRQHAGDIDWAMWLNAQYGSMVRTSLAGHGRPMREAIESAATEDAWTAHVAERSMLNAVAPGAKPRQGARPRAARVGVPGVASAAGVDHWIEGNVSETDDSPIAWLLRQG